MNYCEGCTNYAVMTGKCLVSACPGDIYCMARSSRKTSAVDKPTHYTSGAVEFIDAIRSALTPDEFRGFCKGNILKYVWRERLKNQDQDLQKAAKYLEWLIAEMQKNEKKVE